MPPWGVLPQGAYVGKFLGIDNIWTSLDDIENCKKLTRQGLEAVFSYEPNYQRNKTKVPFSLKGAKYISKYMKLQEFVGIGKLLEDKMLG